MKVHVLALIAILSLMALVGCTQYQPTNGDGTQTQDGVDSNETYQDLSSDDEFFDELAELDEDLDSLGELDDLLNDTDIDFDVDFN